MKIYFDREAKHDANVNLPPIFDCQLKYITRTIWINMIPVNTNFKLNGPCAQPLLGIQIIRQVGAIFI